jgi:hypothetical protein
LSALIILVTAGVPVAAMLLIGAAVWRSRTRTAAIEREFNDVFATTSVERREALLRERMDVKGCTRREAMRLAIQEGGMRTTATR